MPQLVPFYKINQVNVRFKPWGKIQNNIRQKRSLMGLGQIAPGFSLWSIVLSPWFGPLYTVLVYALTKSLLENFPGGAAGFLEIQGIITLQDHILYHDYLEIIRHTWEQQLDFIENFEAIDVTSWIARNGQDEYNHWEAIYNWLMWQTNSGVTIQEQIVNIIELINQLEEAIMLEDENFVNPWSISEWEDDEEINIEALARLRSLFPRP